MKRFLMLLVFIVIGHGLSAQCTIAISSSVPGLVVPVTTARDTLTAIVVSGGDVSRYTWKQVYFDDFSRQGIYRWYGDQKSVVASASVAANYFVVVTFTSGCVATACVTRIPLQRK